jgi:hypothetical protein
MASNKYKTLIILDWDDTLFPTTHTVMTGINNKLMTQDHGNITQDFSGLDNLLYKLLLRMLSYGKVVIVTNASTNWIELSSNLLPKTKKLLVNMDIISARDIMQQKYPENMNMWKKEIFEEVVLEYFASHGYQHIISIGDADYEFIALIELYNEHAFSKKRLLKTVRFMHSPSFHALTDELNVLNNNLDSIIKSKKHMDLKFDSKH